MKRLLVVDDKPVFREPIAAALRYAGYEVAEAGDGYDALDVMHKAHVDAVLLDIAMPRMDGLACLRAIREDQRFAEMPVLLLTAVSDRDHVKTAARLGISGYLLKSSFSLKSMLNRIEQMLDARAGRVAESAAPRSPAPPGATPAPPAPGSSEPAAAPPATPIVSADSTALEALKSIKPIMARSQIDEQLDHAAELRALSPCVTQVLKLTSSASCSVDRLAKVIKQDSAISLKILKLANSSVYSRGEPIDSIHNAVMRIGLTQIRDVVTNIALIDRFSDATFNDRLDTRMFWEHSLATGLLAQEITRTRGGKEQEADAAFTAGLLHDVGRMVYVEQFPEQYRSVLHTTDDLQLPLEQVESRMLLVNHADLMDKVLHMWKFSKNLVNAIALHHLSVGNIRKMSPRTFIEVAILALANRLAHAMLLGSSGNDTLYATEDFCTALNLKDDLLDELVDTIPDTTADLKFSMLSAGDKSDWPRARDAARRRIDGDFRPLFVSAEPQFDALRLFCDALRDRPADAEHPDPPNLAVAHVRNAKDRVVVTTRLRQAEQDAGVDPLPTLIISNTGEITLEDSAMAERATALLNFPLAIARFAVAVNRLLGCVDPGAASTDGPATDTPAEATAGAAA